jgi:hypothetical protein
VRTRRVFDRQRVAVEIDHVQLVGVVREEQVALAATTHQRHALAGERLLEEPLHAAGTLERELDRTLVGGHRALPCEHFAVQQNLDQPGVLQRHSARRSIWSSTKSRRCCCDSVETKASASDGWNIVA